MQWTMPGKWITAAEVFDTWRVIPRAMLFGYSFFVWHTTNFLLLWYTTQPAADRGIEESGTVAAIFAAVTGFSPWIFKIYSENGRNWTDHPSPPGDTPHADQN